LVPREKNAYIDNMRERHPNGERRRVEFERLRQRAGAVVVDNLFRGLSRAGRLHPLARPERHRVTLVRDVPYHPAGARHHHLDVYRPLGRAGRLPVVLYVHGGGFRILSKDTHWVMALAYSRRGYLVFNINYRLAPQHPFPAAVSDVCAAYEWVVRNAAAYGGDPSRIILAGESAGANLVTALALSTAYRRPEPWARRVFELDVAPRAVMPACGMLQVSDPGRFARRRRLPALIADRIIEVSEAYIGTRTADIELADPLLLLERADPPHRPLPPFFAPVGTADPVLDDTRRLKAALDRLSVRCDVRYYPGQPHAFHALIFRAVARRCWQDAFDFLNSI
jgi:acetyl esterase